MFQSVQSDRCVVEHLCDPMCATGAGMCLWVIYDYGHVLISLWSFIYFINFLVKMSLLHSVLMSPTDTTTHLHL